MSSVPPPVLPHPGGPPALPELPDGVTPREPGPPRWPAWSGPVALLAALGGSLAGLIVIMLIAGAAGVRIDKDVPAGINIGATYVQDAMFVLAALAFARMVTRPRPVHFGLRFTRFWPAVGWLLLTWAGFLAASQVFTAIFSPPGNGADSKVLNSLGVGHSTVALVFSVLLVVVVAPMVEEFFFRGYLFPALRTSMNPWLAAVIAGAVFGAIHITNYIGEDFLLGLTAVLSLWVLGFGLCLLYWRTGSLLPCMALHALNNAIAFGVSEHWSAGEIAGLYAGALAAIALIVVPLARRSPAARGRLALRSAAA